jgi:hypothetical protein
MLTHSQHHVLAAFSQRVGLEITVEGRRTLGVEAVRAHMRFLLGIAGPGPSVVTACPAEPILAIAAASQLNSPTVYAEGVSLLIRGLVLKDLVETPLRISGLYTRLLLIMARDAASSWSLLDLDAGSVARVKTTPLSVLLQKLLGNDLGLGPADDLLRAQMLREFAGVHVNYTHIVQLTHELGEVTPELLYNLWCRGAAAQCTHHQAVMDVIFVTYRGDLSAPFDPHQLSYVVLQSKPPLHAQEMSPAAELTGPCILDAAGDVWKPVGHLVIFMDLTSSSSRFDDAGGPLVELQRAPATRPAPGNNNASWEGYMPGSTDEPERWCLTVRGHTIETYPIIGQNDSEFTQLFERSYGYLEPALMPYRKKLLSRTRLEHTLNNPAKAAEVASTSSLF